MFGSCAFDFIRFSPCFFKTSIDMFGSYPGMIKIAFVIFKIIRIETSFNDMKNVFKSVKLNTN